MFLFLADDGLFRHLVGRTVGQHGARLFLQKAQLVEGRVPFVVGHAFAFATIIIGGSLVQQVDEILHFLDFLFHSFEY